MGPHLNKYVVYTVAQPVLSTQSPRGEELEEVSEETGKVGRVEKETGVHAGPPEHSVAELVGIHIRTHVVKASVVSDP